MTRTVLIRNLVEEAFSMDFTLPGILVTLVIFAGVVMTIATLSSMIIKMTQTSAELIQLENVINHSASVLQSLFRNANLGLGYTLETSRLVFKISNADGTSQTISVMIDETSGNENSFLLRVGSNTAKITSFPKNVRASFEMRSGVPVVKFATQGISSRIRFFPLCSRLVF